MATVDGGGDSGGLAGSNGQYARILAGFNGRDGDGQFAGGQPSRREHRMDYGRLTTRGAVTGTGTVGGLVGANFSSTTAELLGYDDERGDRR